MLPYNTHKQKEFDTTERVTSSFMVVKIQLEKKKNTHQTEVEIPSLLCDIISIQQTNCTHIALK